MSSRKILFLTSRLPWPADRGDRARAFNMIRTFAEHGHEVHLISFVGSASETKDLGSLQRYCRSVDVVHQSLLKSVLKAFQALASRTPLQVGFYKSARMRRLIDEKRARERFDLIYVHMFRMAQYVTYAPEYRILDLTDCISHELKLALPYRHGLSRLVYRLETPRVEQYEAEIPRCFDSNWTISEEDRHQILARCEAAHVTVVPIGVDLNHFSPNGAPHEGLELLFVGHLQVFHNVDSVLHFYEHIFPLIRRKYPEVRFSIVGQAPHPRIKRLAAHDPSVRVTGYVPNLVDYLRRATVFVAPLRFCSGIQTKVLEALASGVPVVTSSLVNKGLDAVNDRDLLVRDGPEEFAEAVCTLLGDPALRARIGRQARTFVAERFSWEIAAREIDKVPADAIGQIRTLQIINRLNVGGAAVHEILLTAGLNRAHISTELVTGPVDRAEGDMAYLAETWGVHPLLIPEMRRTRTIGSVRADLVALGRLYRLMLRRRPHVVHTHTAIAGVIGRVAAVLAGVPARIHTFHGHVFNGYYGPVRSWMAVQTERFLARFTNRIVAIGERVGADLVERYKVCPAGQVMVVGHGLDLSWTAAIDLRTGCLRRDFGIRPDTVTVGIVSRLVPVKNHRLFLDAARLLVEAAHAPAAIKFLIVGDGALRPQLEALVERHRLGEHVVFTGWQRDLAYVYADLDIVCLSSLNEATPMTLIEGMAAGKPIVGTDAGGISELMAGAASGDGAVRIFRNGILTPSNDARAFAEALTRLVSDPELRRRMGAAGRTLVDDRYAPDRLVRDMAGLYRTVLS